MRLVPPRGLRPRLSADTTTLGGEIATLLGTRPRRLPAHALYDALGSALFEAICHLPWYPITRAETALLRTHRRSILEAAGRRARIVELGPGNGDKLATLLQGAAATRMQPLDVHLVDVSASALEVATARLRRQPGVTVQTHAALYQAGLHQVAAQRQAGETMLVAFLGSNIGNFDPPQAEALLRDVRGAMRAGDTLLIGTDLVKPLEQLQLAYDDPLGVTAAFNANLLVRLNREFGADFQLDTFAHDARWNAAAQRMEMHLVSLATQRVTIPGAGLVIDVEAGETIWTESSYKYEPSGVDAMLTTAGFTPAAAWQDEDAGFLLTLAVAR
ncbi:dimethylhistidine N-methyltransferase [Luteitalea sp. TBR-22]|nr:dimethylhistidine N-methyltransferase [Luteitalea sp. TBR-22]